MTYPKFRRESKEFPNEICSFCAPFPLSIGKESSILRYFENKQQTVKRSSSRVVLHNKFQTPLNKTSVLVYEYTKYDQFCQKQMKGLLNVSACPFRNCHFTCNSSLVPKADAILMAYSQLNYLRLLDLSASRNSNQIWLLMNDEPYPPSSKYNKFLFNWTVSYRLDSEVSAAAYGITFTRKERMNQFEFTQWIHENYKNRYNEAVW